MRPCPFCGRTVRVRSNDANFGARAYDSEHAGGECDRWKATISFDESPAVEADRKAVVELIMKLCSDDDEIKGILWGPGGWR